MSTTDFHASIDSLNDRYQRDGYVIVRNVVEPELIARAQTHVRQTIADHPGKTYEQIHRLPLWREDPFYHALARHPRVLDVAEQILGPDLALFATGYIIKGPSDGPAVLWHQDGSYWPLEPMRVCTLWIAITPSTPDNGCMRVIPGTQGMDLQELKQRTDVRNLLDSSLDDSLVDEAKAVDLELQPGDISIHHPNIIHGSNANSSANDWRLNLVIRAIPSDTRVTDPEWPGVHHLRGRRRDDIHTYLPTPGEG